MEKNEVIKDYVGKNGLNIEQLIDQYYGYVYIIAKNAKSINLSNEDIEEIISDTFFAIWKNSVKLEPNMPIKPYLAGIIKNVMKNKYRKIQINDPIDNYENTIIDITDYEKIAEENEQTKIIQNTLASMKPEEYEIFIMFYYEAKQIKEIASKMKFSESKVKVTLHRIRKQIQKNLRNGGYGYGKQ